MATAADIQVSGQLGLETNERKVDENTKTTPHSQEKSEVSVTPHYVIQQQYPKTGSSQPFVSITLLGFLLVFLVIVFGRRETGKSKQ